MKKISVMLSVSLLVLICIPFAFVSAQEGNRQMDEERINKIAEKLGVTPEEVRERMAGGRGRGGAGERGGRNQQNNMRGGQKQGSPPDNTVAMATTEKYLFIVKGNTVYQFDIDSLKLKNKAVLDESKEKGKGGKEAWIQKIKKKIEDLRAAGKDEEADKLEQRLKEGLKKMKGGRKDKGQGHPPAPNEANNEGEVLF